MRGSVQPHGDGKWRLFVNAGTDPVTGRRRQITKVVTGSRKEAERALTRLLGEVDDGRHGPGADQTLGQVLDAWLAHKALSVQANTLDTYRASAGYVTEHLRALPIKKLTVAHLEELYAHLLLRGRQNRRGAEPAGLGHSAVVNVHAAIHNALELARRRGWTTVNVAGDAEVPRGKRRKPTPADRTRVAALLAQAAELDPRLAVFIRASVAAGTRRSEMHGLRWSGVDWAASTITFADRVVRGGGAWTVLEGMKTGEDDRTVYVGSNTLAGLRAMYDAAFELAASCGIQLAGDAFVFTDRPDGSESWKPTTTARRFKRCCVAVGLPASTRIHDLRSLCATHLADEGVPIPVIGQRLGHRLNSTTADVYVGRVPESDRLAAEVMERLLDD